MSLWENVPSWAVAHHSAGSREDVVPTTPCPRAATITPLLKPVKPVTLQQLKRGSPSPRWCLAWHVPSATAPCPLPCPFLLGLPEVLLHLPASLAHTSFKTSTGILSVSQEDPYFFTNLGDCCVMTCF